MSITNYYVDVDGRTYRVALSGSGRAMIVVRRSHDGKDTGRPLVLSGKTATRAITAAHSQAREALRRETHA